MKTLKLATFVDADHGGCPETARSTSGCVTQIVGAHSYGTVSWVSMRQKRASHSTGEAELVATNDGLRRLSLPALLLYEAVLDRSVTLDLYSDSQASIGVVKSGSSSALNYTRKSQRLSIAWLRDILQELSIRIEYVITDLNIADLFTKHLLCPRYTELRKMLYMCTGFEKT